MAHRRVVQSVRTSRGVAAALAACVVLSACASGEGGQQATTTSPSATEVPGNPWDLPIEQRPALFDPCAEIPVEAIEQGVGGPVELDERLTRHRPAELMACGWASNEIILNVVGTWKSQQEFLADPSFVDVKPSSLQGVEVFSARDRSDRDRSCYQIYFTPRGAVFVSVDLVSSLSSFRNEQFVDPCDVLSTIIQPIAEHVPRGEFG